MDSIFASIAGDPDLYVSNWKCKVLELAKISNTSNIFSENARSGFNYLAQVVYCTICNVCRDKKAFMWLKSFAKAWIHQEELPLFPKGCFTGSC